MKSSSHNQQPATWPEDAYCPLLQDPGLARLAQDDPGLRLHISQMRTTLDIAQQEGATPTHDEIAGLAEQHLLHYIGENGIGRSLKPSDE